MSSNYPWRRFWCPPDASISLGDGGYLRDPSDAKWGQFYNPHLVELGEVENFPCLVLLGEPGMGKSRALEAMPVSPTARPGGAAVASRHIDLREFQTDDRLCRNLFEATWFETWSNGSGHLTLFLDSLDECLLGVETVATILASGLSRCPTARLSLRIACRTADWPPSLGEKLRAIWGDDGARTYEMAPLRRADVVAAAQVEGVDAAAFTAEVARVGVVPLAIKPVTLKLLLNLFRQNARLPTTQAELYLKGCRLLCDEVNPERREAKRVGILSADQRFAVAARIAAATQFGNRFAVWQGPDQGDVPPEDVVVADLAGGTEAANGDEFEVTEFAVRDTLRHAGLFSSRGPGRLGWAHQTYAEFLAAHYAVSRPLAPRQVMGLLRHPDDPDGRLVPQLHEVAGWLATLSADVLRQVMVTDPDVLLRSDLSVTAEADRARLVETLLRLAAEEKFIGTTWRDGYRLDRLAYPGLADQLRPYLRGRDRGVLARRLAVDIATDCGLSVLQDDLAAVALDANDELDVRVRCAQGVLRLANAETKVRLKPLALGLAGDDPDDDLRGCGLRAVWPKALSSTELFAHLPAARHLHRVGSYGLFVGREILPHLTPAGLPDALGWVATSGRPVDGSFSRLVDGIMAMAWANIETPGVVDAFAAAAWARILRYESLVRGEDSERFEASLASSVEPRRRLVAAMVRLGAERGFDVPTLKMKGGLTHVGDWEWMLGQIEAASSEAEQTYWIKLLSWPFLWLPGGRLNALLDVSSRVPALTRAMGPDFEPVFLDSPNAAAQRDRWIKSKTLDHRVESPKTLSRPPAERVSKLLARMESGRLRAWHPLNMALMLEAGANRGRNVLEWDLADLPGWESAAEQVRARITAVAVRYVLTHSPDTAGWLGRNSTPGSAFSDYRAIRLVSEASDGTELSPVDWQRWAEFVMACPGPDENDERIDGHRQLVATAYHHASEAMRCTLGRVIDGQNEVGDRLFVLDQLPAIWDESVGRLLSSKARDPLMKATCLGQLLDELLSRGAAGAGGLARTLVGVPPGADTATRGRAVTAARALIILSADAGWDTVWPAIEADAGLGREVISAIARERQTLRGHVFVNRLSDRQVADLFIFVATHFPRRSRSYGGSVDDVDELQDSLLTQLRDRGTREACDEIERVARSLPQLDWLKWTLMDARANTRRRTWVPPRPTDVVALARDRRACIVRSGDELMQAVIESLRRLQEKFQGETPAAVDVWNFDGDKPWAPKDENAFSNYVTRHLRDDLGGSNLLFAREVEIRRSHGSNSGERTDIHVDAVVPKSGEGKHCRVSLIIETKGCWNPSLETDMESQLVGRYLRENECRHGLYLVGWFFCRYWRGTLKKKPKCRNWTETKAQVAFDAQAARCSDGRVSVKAIVLDATLR